jgi:hypothetical protein
MSNFLTIDQLMILLTGVPAVFITQCKPAWMKWAPVLGMVGQPFWIYSSWHAHVWGMLFVNCLYTFAWGKGIFTYWIWRSHAVT